MPPSRKSIRKWGYTREVDHNPPHLGIIKRLIDNDQSATDTRGWQHYKISESSAERVINRYSIADDTYITTDVQLDILGPDRMRHRDMIMDNLRAARIDPKQLCFIGLDLVVDDTACSCAENAFEFEGFDPNAPCPIEFHLVCTAIIISLFTTHFHSFRRVKFFAQNRIGEYSR